MVRRPRRELNSSRSSGLWSPCHSKSTKGGCVVLRADTSRMLLKWRRGNCVPQVPSLESERISECFVEQIVGCQFPSSEESREFAQVDRQERVRRRSAGETTETCVKKAMCPGARDARLMQDFPHAPHTRLMETFVAVPQNVLWQVLIESGGQIPKGWHAQALSSF